LRGDIAWLKKVEAIIAEFHPLVIDYPGVIKTIESAGFVYIRPGSVAGTVMDCFLRACPEETQTST